MNELVYGLITGVIFGFLLQKGRVIRYDKQIGALRLLDMTIVKFMFSTILVAMVGVYLLKDLGIVKYCWWSPVRRWLGSVRILPWHCSGCTRRRKMGCDLGYSRDVDGCSHLC
jgi:hypothetical protein